MVLKAKEENKNSIYVPDIARISRIEKVSPTEKLFNIAFEDEGKQNNFKFLPGQFIELTIFGLGEAPFCLASNPNNKEFFELCIRNAGNVSGALHRMEEGSRIGIRGPFGRGYFPFEKMRNHNVLLIAGGLGMVPLMSLIKYIMQYREDYKELMIIYGAVNPSSILFRNDILENDLLEYIFSNTIRKMALKPYCCRYACACTSIIFFARPYGAFVSSG